MGTQAYRRGLYHLRRLHVSTQELEEPPMVPARSRSRGQPGGPSAILAGVRPMAQPTPTVLIMEDDAVLRTLLQELLEDLADCQVETAASGVMGSARAASGGIDLVLLDPRLPDL